MPVITLRQISPDVGTEPAQHLFDLAFPEFLRRAQARQVPTFPLPPAAAIGESRIHYITDSERYLLHEMTKPRRYAGGRDLGPRNYYTVAGSENPPSDDGTLVSELHEYWNPDWIFHTGNVMLLDGGNPADRRRIAELHIQWDQNPSTIICIFWPLHKNHVTAAARLAGRDEPMSVVLFLRASVTETSSDGVLDLRHPKGQAEFVQLVRTNRFLRSKLTDPKDPDLFLLCIPTLMAEQRGGSVFHAYVGEILRRRGAHGLIYPSARRDVATEVVDGILTRWTGWCFVDYAHAPEVQDAPFEAFENYLDQLWTPTAFSGGARIHRSSDPLYSGSFAVQGLEDDRWNLISAIIENAQKLVAEVFADARKPRWFSREESESLSRTLKELTRKRWSENRSDSETNL